VSARVPAFHIPIGSPCIREKAAMSLRACVFDQMMPRINERMQTL
jgi:hypothetical protein